MKRCEFCGATLVPNSRRSDVFGPPQRFCGDRTSECWRARRRTWRSYPKLEPKFRLTRAQLFELVSALVPEIRAGTWPTETRLVEVVGNMLAAEKRRAGRFDQKAVAR